jgi:transglutaminase-like putative cysteine protease
MNARMHFFVRHETVYRYSVPVQLAPHALRLTPRPEAVRNLSHTLNLQPAPHTRRDRSDELGNVVIDLGFVGTTQLLRIESCFELDTFAPPPLPAAASWLSDPNDGLGAYRIDDYPDAAVQRFARELSAQVGHAPVAFLDQLNRTLFIRTDQQWRPEGAAQPAAATLATWQGACRDLTVLFVSACRSLGLASRFTSGYLAPLDGLDGPHQLHAWPEVFLPGIGWRGWDPTQGQRVIDAYVPLCAAPTQSATMAVEGGYFFAGAVVNTTLDFDLRISTRHAGS